MNTPTATQRIQANRNLQALRASQQYGDARILEAAIFWDSFPASYTSMQATLGAALLTSEFGSENYHNIATTIYLIINESK